jgi:hypothetical protein
MRLRPTTSCPAPAGSPIGKLRITAVPDRQSTHAMPYADFEKEGFAYLESIGATVGNDKLTPGEFWNRWVQDGEMLWVVRFEPVEIFANFKAEEH